MTVTDSDMTEPPPTSQTRDVIQLVTSSIISCYICSLYFVPSPLLVFNYIVRIYLPSKSTLCLLRVSEDTCLEGHRYAWHVRVLFR